VTTEADAALVTEAVIDRFGGIRPMATKLATPVTTVQGWKKRGIIPQIRHAEILTAARREGIALEPAELAATDPGGTTRPDARPPEVDSDVRPDTVLPPIPTPTVSPPVAPQTVVLRRGGGVAWLALIVALLIGAAGAAAGFAGWRFYLAPLEARVASLEARGGGGSNGDLTRRVAALEARVGQPAPASGQAPSGPAADQVAELEKQVADLKAGAAQSEQLAKGLSDLQIAAGGRELLAQSMRDIQSSMAANQGEIERLTTRLDKVDSALADRRQQALRAEAVTLAVGQLRAVTATSRPFAKELAAVRALTQGDAELGTPLDQLQPFADSGVPSSDDVTADFKRLAPELVRSAVVGDGQSWWRQALYHLESVISIRRVGENVPGDTTEAIVARTEAKLDDDDLPGAIAVLQALSGAAAELASSWAHDAAHRVAVDSAESDLTRIAIGRIADGTLSGQSQGAGQPSQGTAPAAAPQPAQADK
jgi:hypothetical protein